MRKKGDAHFFDVPYFWVDSPYRVLEKNREVIFFLPCNVEKKTHSEAFQETYTECGCDVGNSLRATVRRRAPRTLLGCRIVFFDAGCTIGIGFPPLTPQKI